MTTSRSRRTNGKYHDYLGTYLISIPRPNDGTQRNATHRNAAQRIARSLLATGQLALVITINGLVPIIHS